MRDASPRSMLFQRAASIAAGLALACCAHQAVQPGATSAPAMVTVEAANLRVAWNGAGEWLLAHAIEQPPGIAWAADPEKPETVSNGLYSGYSGVVLFLLEGWTVNHDARWLAAGRAGADHLAAQVEIETDPGLYTGLAGMAFVLERAAALTGDPRYRAAGVRAIERVIGAAHAVGAGVDWGPTTPDADNPPSNDIVGGAAGTGLALLWADRVLHVPGAVETATRAGRRLVEVGIVASPDEQGRKWIWAAGIERIYPNFAHGTAGVAYFLATLFEATHDAAFLDAARAGARYLESIATVNGSSCLIYRHEPDAKDLYYYSWCHGPAGTSRLFYRLFEVTGDRAYMDWVEKLARGVLASGIPESRQPGFWNNVSQCCGSAGVGEYFLALHRLTGKPEYLAMADRMTSDLLTRATHGDGAWRWVQAENRTKPEAVVAQTGYMQGAAGIGLWLLRHERYRARADIELTLPDSPF